MYKLLLLVFFTSLVFAQVEQEVKKELTLEEQAAEEAKIREEVLKKYRVSDESKEESLDSDSQKEDLKSENDNLEIQDVQNLPQDLKDKINAEVLTDLFKNSENNTDQKDAPKLKESFLSNMIPASMKDILAKFLKTNPFSNLSKEDVKAMLVSQTEGKPLGEAFKKNPKLLDFAVDWIRDPKALPAFMGMANKPEQMKNYGIVVLIVFAISFILNFLNKSGGLVKRIFKKLLITFGSLIVNLVLFYWFFKEELDPTLEIAKKYFF